MKKLPRRFFHSITNWRQIKFIQLFLNEKCYKMFYLNQVNPIVSVELIDTNEPESDSDEEQEQLEESKNVGSLPHWDEFLKANQVNTVSFPFSFTIIVFHFS